MNVIQIDRVSPADATRDAFAARAYAGDLPRDRWIEAQTLVSLYDDATSGDARALVLDSMAALTASVDATALGAAA